MSGDGGGKANILVAREAKRAEVEIDLMFLKVILHVSLGVGMGMSILIMIARWSEMLRLMLESWFIVRPVEQRRSRVCPRV